MTKGLVYSYMRFSDPRQAAGNSSERQRAYAARWALEHDLQLDESLSMEDKGLSAYHQHHIKHGALGAFLAAVEQGRVPPGSFLVVEGLDRLSRAEPILAQAQLAQIINAGISVVTASDNKVYSRERLKANPMDLVYSLLVMIRAHEESETKSNRVRAAIRRQCEGWIAGTFRGIIRNGTDPAWLRWNGERWEFIEERVHALRTAIDLYRRGYGVNKVMTELRERKLSLTGRPPDFLQIFRLVRQRALIGERELEVGGQAFRLEGYYPPVLTLEEWQDVQSLADRRGLRPTRGTIPNLFTGLNIARCGYCGSALISQNMMGKRRPDGTFLDSHRRIHCAGHQRQRICPVPLSRSIVPYERALMSYCSDMLNLQALYRGDRAAAPRARIAAARKKLAELDQQLERLTNALLESDDAPAAFLKRAKDLETDKAKTQAEITASENELAAVARSDLDGADAKWRDLAEGVAALDYESRTRARQLVSDTFESITVYGFGIEPDPDSSHMDLVLVAKGGTARMLRIDATGAWEAGAELTLQT